jgi:predicted dehydrogenase
MADKVKWGVIGAGGIADRKTIPGLLEAPNCELAALVDVQNVEELAKKHGVETYGTDPSVILDDESIQAVYIATPVWLHLEQIRDAAKAGKHILCEKPLTLSPEETRQAVQACTDAGVLLQEGYMMKFHGAHRAVREAIEAGKLGQVTYMRAQLSCWFPPMDNWRQDPEKGGGGALMDMATHLLDLLEYFAGPATRVGARIGNQVHSYTSEDASVTMLEFASGAFGTVDCFFNLPDEASRTRLEIYGSKGAILTEGTIGQGDGGTIEGIFGLGTAAYDAQQNKDVAVGFQPMPYEKINMYMAECQYFADCILKGGPVEMNGPDEAIHVADLTAKAYESAKTGTFLDV